MDTVPEPDFFDIFDRVTDYVDLEGAYTAEEILDRIKESKAWKRAPTKYSRRKRAWVKQKGSLQRLVSYGFHRRTAKEFLTGELDNLVRLTILWGKEKARLIQKALAKKRIRRGLTRGEEMARRTALKEEREVAARGARRLTLRERIFSERRRRRG